MAALVSRTALVTGAGRGIGRETAKAFARAGWQVVAGVRDPSGTEPFVQGEVQILGLDVTDPASVRSGVRQAEEIAGGPLACVVNNAGWALFGAVEDLDLDLARQEFETNVFGGVSVLQAALPGMRRAGGGVVVSVSTLSGRVPLPLFGMYSASKLSVAALSEALALELGALGIRVVLIEAGVVATEFARSTVVSGSTGDPASVYAAARDSVLGKLRWIRQECPVSAEEVAAAILGAAEDPSAPFRVVLPDDGLRPLIESLGGPPEDAHQRVRAAFGLDDASSVGGPP